MSAYPRPLLTLQCLLTHLEHQRSLHDTTAHAKKTSEKAGEKADGRVAQSVFGVPFYVALHVPVVQARFEAPPLHEIVSHPPATSFIMFERSEVKRTKDGDGGRVGGKRIT